MSGPPDPFIFLKIGVKAGFSKKAVTFGPGIDRERNPFLWASLKSVEKRRELSPQ